MHYKEISLTKSYAAFLFMQCSAWLRNPVRKKQTYYNAVRLWCWEQLPYLSLMWISCPIFNSYWCGDSIRFSWAISSVLPSRQWLDWCDAEGFGSQRGTVIFLLNYHFCWLDLSERSVILMVHQSYFLKKHNALCTLYVENTTKISNPWLRFTFPHLLYRIVLTCSAAILSGLPPLIMVKYKMIVHVHYKYHQYGCTSNMFFFPSFRFLLQGKFSLPSLVC